MTPAQAKLWAKEIAHYCNGGSIWGYVNKEWVKSETAGFTSNDPARYVIADEHFEARKAWALGEDIEVKDSGMGGWEDLTDTPLWSKGLMYRAKKKEWYDDIPEDGILCWVSNNNSLNKKTPSMVIKKDGNKFLTNIPCVWWHNAEPIKSKECWIDESEMKKLLHFRDSSVGLWATDKPEQIPDTYKSIFFQLKDGDEQQ